MALIAVDVEAWEGPLPERVSSLIDSAGQCLERFHVYHHRAPVPGFYPSDFELVYRVFRSLVEKHATPANCKFIEWGAGIPAVSALAEQCQWTAMAFECDERLFAVGTAWLQEENLSVQLERTSFVPDTFVQSLGDPNLFQGIQVSPQGVTKKSPDELRADVVFAYPWPGEAEAIESLFEFVSAPGDRLVTFHGSLEIKVQEHH